MNMPQPLRVVAVSYLNAKPFIHGLEQAFAPSELALELAVPSACAERFAQGAADLALVPVGALHSLPNARVLPGYCIAANGFVNSVYIFSQVPAAEIKALALDSDSRTSNALAQIVLAERYGTLPPLLAGAPSLPRIEGTTAGVVIGDKAVAAREAYTYIYDLAEEWKALTGKPFVFAVWVVRAGALPWAVQERVGAAFTKGLADVAQVATRWAPRFGLTELAAQGYLSQSIQYRMTGAMEESMEIFQQKMVAHELIKTSQLENIGRV